MTEHVGKPWKTVLAPVLGAGAIGVCPLCWIGSASLLTYLGLGALIPIWPWVAFGFIGLGAIGFVFDYRAHKNLKPFVVLLVGALLLYFGRYVYDNWQMWGTGVVTIVTAVIYNKSFFRKPQSSVPNQTVTIVNS